MPAAKDRKTGLALPVLGQPSRERADVARNRVALLRAARQIMVSEGLDAVRLDRVAAAAGVGIGTVYRHFGDRSGLANAMLDEHERQFQEAFLRGPPPLGPGAPPRERIVAFLDGELTRLETEAELQAVAQSRTVTARFSAGAYQAAHLHLFVLLRQLGLDRHTDYVADVLQAAVAANLYLQLRRERGLSPAEIHAGQRQLLDALLPVAEPSTWSGSGTPSS